MWIYTKVYPRAKLQKDAYTLIHFNKVASPTNVIDEALTDLFYGLTKAPRVYSPTLWWIINLTTKKQYIGFPINIVYMTFKMAGLF